MNRPQPLFPVLPRSSGRRVGGRRGRIAGLVLAAGLLGSGVEGAELIVDEPEVGHDYHIVDMTITNNDVGAVYASGVTNTTSSVAQQIADLSGNTVSEVMSTWTYNISGEVDAGWSLVPQPDGSIYSTTAAPFGNDVWSESDPSLDTQIQSVGINNDGLERNGVPGYQAFTLSEVEAAGWDPTQYDAIIVLTGSAEAEGLYGAGNYAGEKPSSALSEAFVGDLGGPTISASGPYYELMLGEEFLEWTSYDQEHGGLASGGDANGNGRSNYLDYASGQDAEALGLLPIVELDGTTLTLRRRINGIDALATAEYSDDLIEWHPLEEGLHYEEVGNTVSGAMRTLEWELLPGHPAVRFFRQRFGE